MESPRRSSALPHCVPRVGAGRLTGPSLISKMVLPTVNCGPPSVESRSTYDSLVRLTRAKNDPLFRLSLS